MAHRVGEADIDVAVDQQVGYWPAAVRHEKPQPVVLIDELIARRHRLRMKMPVLVQCREHLELDVLDEIPKLAALVCVCGGPHVVLVDQ